MDSARLDCQVDFARPNWARMRSHWLGGKDNFEADRMLADTMTGHLPGIPSMVRDERRFLFRAVRRLVTEFGVRQFLEVGCGFPTICNTHDIAKDLDPSARVLYVDDDPVVAAHARALLVSPAAGQVRFLRADARKPASVLHDPTFAATLDLCDPVGLMLVSVLAHVCDDSAHEMVAALMAALPRGSYLTISHPTGEFAQDAADRAAAVARKAGLTYRPRSAEQVGEFLAGLHPVAPGVVALRDWQPDLRRCRRVTRGIDHWVGMAVKP
jgi:hypothetical protein